ncbi:MAG TPA: hypothetical protein VK203_25110 [Nostocaceae cyanobacterium]|nr:hypothetical protein [Nostocaceae cyanobacterium]
MKNNFWLAFLFSLVLVLSLFTNKVVAQFNYQELPPTLITAIRQDFLQHREGFDSYWRESKDHRVFFIDLNNDRIKEAILYPAGGTICSNRSCSIYIYTKIGNKYKRISANTTDGYSAIIGSRNEPSIGVLNSSRKGWRDLATRLFDYDTRTEKWSRISYGSRGYATDSPLVTVPEPRTILASSSAIKTDFRKVFAP